MNGYQVSNEKKINSIANQTKVRLNDYYILTMKFIKVNKNFFKLTTQKDNSRTLVNFYIFPDSAHQAQFRQHQSHTQLDENSSHHGSHERLFYPLQDKKG